MGITFNGNVTINGNVEFFDNGSVKITSNEVTVSVDELSKFIEDNLKYSLNKTDYLIASDTLKNSNDKNAIINAFSKLKDMGKEIGKGIWITGLSQICIEMIKKFLNPKP